PAASGRPRPRGLRVSVTPLSVFLLFYEQCMRWAHIDRALDLVAGVFGGFGVDDLDLAPFGHPEVIRRLQLAHGVALTQVQVDFDAKCHAGAPRWCACGSGPWRAGQAAPPSWSDRCGSCRRAAPSRTHTREGEPRRSP